MRENFSNLVKEIDMQVQEAQRVPNKTYTKRTIPRHIIIKMSKVKERVLKTKEKAESFLQESSHKTVS